MVLGFNRRFVNPILAERKIHTLRLDPGNRWHAGRRIDAATGVRTKHYNKFMEAPCTGTQTCTIDYSVEAEEKHFYTPVVTIDGRVLDADEVETLAKNDGFADACEFCKWFSKDWEGKIIHWTSFRY